MVQAWRYEAGIVANAVPMLADIIVQVQVHLHS